jgi:hypothetical protein
VVQDCILVKLGAVSPIRQEAAKLIEILPKTRQWRKKKGLEIQEMTR